MKISRGIWACFGLAMMAVGSAKAIFVRGESVPADRLIRNVETEYKRTPKDAEVVYTLGRLHSLAFAQGEKNVQISPSPPNDPKRVPRFAPYSGVRIAADATLEQRKAQAAGHLKTSLQLYRQAIKLKPKEALYWFSYGWTTEQGAALADQVNALFLSKPRKVSARDWRKEALKAYRQAFELSREFDLKREGILEGADTIVSVESAQSILDLFEKMKLTRAEEEEKTRLETHLEKVRRIPRAITPLIFPLNGEMSLSALTANAKPVQFNLAAERTARQWNWVTPDAGILVWDPKRTGSITSGRQLFGSVTWWIFWNNGFEPLAALDDNRDGWLDGAELAGIAVWQDKNSNGRSDAGEVIPVETWGVKRIAVRADGKSEGVPTHGQGIVLHDGATRPLYDWTPKSRE